MIVPTRRERLLTGGLVLMAAIGLLYAVAVKPACDRTRTLERIIPEKQRELRELQAMSVEYLAWRKRFNDFQARAAAQDRQFQLPSYLETLIEKHGLAQKVTTIAPSDVQLRPDYSESVVEIAFEQVSLKQLVDFIKAIEDSDVFMQIASLHIRQDPVDGTLLGSTLEIRSPRYGQDAVAAQSPSDH